MRNIIIAGVIIVIGAIIFLTHPFKGMAPSSVNSETTTYSTSTPASPSNNTSNTSTSTANTVIPAYIPETLPATSTADLKVISTLQAIWNKYLTAAKNHDLATLSSLSFQLSDNCQHPDKTQQQCFAAMDGLVKVFANIKTTDFVIAWYDPMQAILMTKQEPATLDGNPGFYQPRIFFGVKDGTYKVLAVFPDWGRFADKTKVAAANIQSFLRYAGLDSDKDGITDMEENCDNGGGPGSIPNCKKTDPFVRDENHNGWWDGVEEYIRPIQN